jgi:hypothetical protein
LLELALQLVLVLPPRLELALTLRLDLQQALDLHLQLVLGFLLEAPLERLREPAQPAVLDLLPRLRLVPPKAAVLLLELAPQRPQELVLLLA